jgi:glyoxylase-like metal-dependent hydrolase (beta-lactamase superfamily II)
MSKDAIRYEFDSKPGIGETLEVAPGIHWLRMPLPFSLQHINLWLLADGDGWTIADTGLGDEATRATWRQYFSGILESRPIKHVVVTHMHPDHVGCAGWLTDQFDVELSMTREEYALCRILVADTGRSAPDAGINFYRAAGYTDEQLERYRKVFGFFGKYVTPLPESYHRLYDGQVLALGNYEWEVIVGRGHSPEHACLYCAAQNLLISGDQVLPAISSNVSVYPTEPEANPLKDWIESLLALRARVPENVLVLPAHGKAFRGVHARIDALVDGHRSQLDKLLAYCKTSRRAVDTFPALYRRQISGENLMLATGEAIAHLHYLFDAGQLSAETDASGVRWYQSITEEDSQCTE